MAAEAPIPIYTNLTDLHSNLGTSLDHAVRWDNLAKQFENRFGRKPQYIARAPGRVNLIGEHIDYALFGVLPAAIERDILIAISPRPTLHDKAQQDSEHHGPGGVVAENLHPKYTRQTFAPKVHAEWNLDIDTKELRWESYVKAGYYGVLSRYFSNANSNAHLPVPVDLLVTGSVPAGSGLSSSAAMVVASTLAFLAANAKLDTPERQAQDGMNKGELTRIAMENEKRVGVNSGGMDQASSIMSGAGEALYIGFYPRLRAEEVKLPGGAVFVCANSMRVADKAVGAKRGYNLRVVETLVGARVLARQLDVKVEEEERVTFREVLGRWVGEDVRREETEKQGMSVEELRGALERVVEVLDVLKRKGAKEGDEIGVTMEEMIEMTGMAKEQFEKVYLSWVVVEATHFQLYKRAKHVFTEALRVLQFREACLLATESSNTLKTLGKLMNESQVSCNELFECSCDELNELTRICRESGAIGSRLTGAGWGGCTVSLVPEGHVEDFIKKVANAYGPYRGLEGEKLSEVIFATKPSSGACVYKFAE